LRPLLIALAIVAMLVAGFAVALWAAGPRPTATQIVVPAKTPFTKGRYFAFAQPWGSETMRWTRWWAPHADALAINLGRFPADTAMSWRWPPFVPTNGPGVWAYNQVSYGNYDGGAPEVSVAARRVRDIRELRQAYAWRIDNALGDGNVLTEFYLRSSPTDVNAKTLEIGFFLHAPDSTKRFFGNSKQIGVFTDTGGRRWRVALADKFCMFLPEQDAALTRGTLDMLPALAWLRSKRLVTGDEWFWGLAIGVEPVRGVGRYYLDRWSVALR
jgi:hypothetical protein